MTRKKKTLIVIVGVVACIMVLRECGVLDANFYASNLSATQNTTVSRVTQGEEQHFSYHLSVKHGNETLESYFHSYNNLPAIEIEANLDDPVYSGNCALPFFKKFRMTYQCTFGTPTNAIGHIVNGRIQGEVKAEIRGLCSRRKAKDLAFEEAKKQVSTYLQNQLSL